MWIHFELWLFLFHSQSFILTLTRFVHDSSAVHIENQEKKGPLRMYFFYLTEMFRKTYNLRQS